MKRSERSASWPTAALTALCLTTAPIAAGEWPGWRGPSRDGSLGTDWSCATWPEELQPGWKITVGEGHSSPIVAGGKVFQLSRQGEEEVVRAVELATGEELWRQSYPVEFKPGMGSGKHGSGPRSTPVHAEGRLFTLGISGVLTAWEAASGELLWRLDAAERFPKGAPKYGAATSPLADGSRLIVYLGGKDGGALLALDAESGDELWASEAGGPAYASPVAVELEGVRQIVTQSEQGLISVDASSGNLLWKLSVPMTMTSHNAVTPLPLADGSIVLAGKKSGLLAVRPARTGETWSAPTAWKNEELSGDLSSPVAEGGRLFGLAPTKKGRLYAVEAATGRPVWMTEGRDAENAALLAAPGTVLVLTTEGDLWILDSRADGLSRLAEYRVSDEGWTWAHPAVVGDRLLVKDRDSLALWVLDCG